MTAKKVIVTKRKFIVLLKTRMQFNKIVEANQKYKNLNILDTIIIN